MCKTYTVYKTKCCGCTKTQIFSGAKFQWKKFLKSKQVKNLLHANYIVITVVEN